MGAEESRLSLRALAQRLDTLERENAELRSKVAMLEGSSKSLSRYRYLEEDELGASELDER
jgi:predicted  nucleic acid-binding Zn-ribbon protein